MFIFTGSGIKGLVKGVVIRIPIDIYVIWNDFFDGATVEREDVCSHTTTLWDTELEV